MKAENIVLSGILFGAVMTLYGLVADWQILKVWGLLLTLIFTGPTFCIIFTRK